MGIKNIYERFIWFDDQEKSAFPAYPACGRQAPGRRNQKWAEERTPEEVKVVSE
jgi:hypothetical protein